MRRWALAAVLVASVAVAAGCGSDDTSSTSATTEWADGVCQALTTWGDALSSTADSLKDGGLSTEGLSDAADEIKGATETLGDDLRSLGRPDTEAGQSAQDTLTQLADELSGEIDTITAAVDEASGVSGAVQAIATVSSTLTQMASQVGGALSSLEALEGGQELEDAFSQAESCTELEGGS